MGRVTYKGPPPHTGRPNPTNPECTAQRHGTRRAYETYRCRCTDAIEAARAHWRRGPGRPIVRARNERSGDVDPVAVERATHGDRIPLTIRERALVVDRLTTRKMSARQIAEILGMTARTVVRYRAGDGTRHAHHQERAA